MKNPGILVEWTNTLTNRVISGCAFISDNKESAELFKTGNFKDKIVVTVKAPFNLDGTPVVRPVKFLVQAEKLRIIGYQD